MSMRFKCDILWESTQKVDTRARARFASLKIANTGTEQNWRFGTFRADVQLDGMRG